MLVMRRYLRHALFRCAIGCCYEMRCLRHHIFIATTPAPCRLRRHNTPYAIATRLIRRHIYAARDFQRLRRRRCLLRYMLRFIDVTRCLRHAPAYDMMPVAAFDFC